ncbi:Small auxin-up RNA [Trema orientale]|uniref:Small auxin-up RNA n=1 Tax=Trema orientale TaxID=63057 RepID=A0A2P5EY11_TREOI|nr:Small auxin-up RNA [Trema orientale]
MMISLKRLIAIARKWQKMAGIARSRRTISLPRIISHRGLPHKGHFVVYSVDMKRFVVPLTYLKCSVFRELLRMSEEEFGPPKDGPITLPCDAVSMEYIVSVVKREVSMELERALLLSLASASRECPTTGAVPESLVMLGHCPIIGF